MDKITLMSEDVEVMWSYLSNPDQMLHLLELCGRVCHQSIPKGDPAAFINKLVGMRHTSVIEHVSVTVKITCSRACSHQIVRHRLCSFSQESQRYVNYEKRGYRIIVPECLRAGLELPMTVTSFGSPMIRFAYLDPRAWRFVDATLHSLNRYEELLEAGLPPEDARYLLPNATATTLFMTTNLREWLHIFQERADNEHAQWEIRNIMSRVKTEMQKVIPAIFG